MRSLAGKGLVPFTWHDINEEDFTLLEDDKCLILLDARSHHNPDEFWDSTGLPMYRVLRNSDGPIRRSWVQTGCFPGFSLDKMGDGCSILSGEYIDVFFRQVIILQFLVSFRDLVLEVSLKIRSIGTIPLSELSSNQLDRTCISDWRRSLVYPYLPPGVDT